MLDLNLNNKIKEKLYYKQSCFWTSTISKNYELYKYATDILNIDKRFKNYFEFFYYIVNDLDFNTFPKCLKCNSVLSLTKFKEGKKYCCKKCSDTSEEKKQRLKDLKNTVEYQEKFKKTCMERYGVDNPTKCKNISKKISEKFKTHSTEYTKEVTNKRQETCLEKYGVSHVSQSLDVREKMKEKELLLYGVEHHTKRDNYKNIFENITYNKFKRFSKYVIPLFTVEEFIEHGANPYIFAYKWKCLKCNSEFNSKITRHKKYIPRCVKCYPSSISNTENVIIEYLTKYNLDIKKSDRTIMSPFELDIVIPSKKIAIEFNGNYWHSELQKKDNINIHLNKTNKCLERDYRLIHIFEDEWQFKAKIVKARLKNILGLTKRSIYARKCLVKEIDNNIKEAFLDKYHIQGNCVDSVRYGLYYKNRLVAVMTFGKHRFDDKEGYELIRYVTIANFNIVGGAGKLLKHFRNTYPTETIISYADKRWSQGHLYKKLGFILINETTPNYFYMHKNNLLNRFSRHQFMKHKLKDKLEKFDESLSEYENMINNGYTRIWDCGNYVFELKP